MRVHTRVCVKVLSGFIAHRLFADCFVVLFIVFKSARLCYVPENFSFFFLPSLQAWGPCTQPLNREHPSLIHYTGKQIQCPCLLAFYLRMASHQSSSSAAVPRAPPLFYGHFTLFGARDGARETCRTHVAIRKPV